MKNNNKPVAGVKEIATRAHVSIATVDRVIHDRGGVSAKTKDRIQSIIKELNYQPNVLAQRLALASRGVLRLVTLLPEISEETEFWEAPLNGINRAGSEIRQYGIQIDRYFFDQNDQDSFDRQVRQISRLKSDGVLFSPTFPEESRWLIDKLEERHIPYVLINTDIPDYDALCYIGADIYHSGCLAAQLVSYCLRDKQRVLIANIAEKIAGNYAILRKEEGFNDYFAQHGLSGRVSSFNTRKTDYPSIAAGLTRIIKKQPDIGAIFVTNSRVSMVARFLEAKGRTDILLVGYDFINDNVHFLKKGVIDFLICEKPQEQGYRGIMTLFQHLVYSNAIEQKYLMPIDIITRENYRFYRN
jgi:LacI family transcriptional regulator